ncbi:hypothetical protein FOZ63_027008 [Perkinsus olseni]|uniref:Uncharacterized protein n=1 Tax=Perkinsus olseni TaxID=32597 RepID=A0A7J6RHI4_PEROL|nr:hypothetical protein FOZ60_009558 [Perkinsus olseni]KAF4720063.1 hypothetical protein FOZ62_023625 [Perkinsus olseni]KAF4723349.1 hypothetical protein FOZ63_027008 [Perkinsus olseni]
MEHSIAEYDPLDTPSGFLRWSRPVAGKPRRDLRRVLKEALHAKRSRFRLAVWALLSALTVASGLSYIGTLLTISYNLPSVLQVSVENLTLERYVWCGLVSLAPRLQYCAQGSAVLKIRNRLWTQVAILNNDDSVLWFMETDSLELDVLEVTLSENILVGPVSERLHTVPMTLKWTALEAPLGFNVTLTNALLEVYALGYSFEYTKDYDHFQGPHLTLSSSFFSGAPLPQEPH